MKTSSIIALTCSELAACTVLWDGRFNDMTTSVDLDNWSWANQVGEYQWYIHGDGVTTDYVNLSPDYKNPADTGSEQGVKMTLDSTAYWNGQTMRRTELIPQTTAAINAGTVWYHFSMMREDTNAPSVNREHQICFFESHFTEMKAGWLSGSSGTSDTNLRWMANSVSQWDTEFTAGVWHNIAYEIDFTGGTVGFWYSTGADDLVLTVEPVSVSASSNGADWHLGVLELPRDGRFKWRRHILEQHHTGWHDSRQYQHPDHAANLDDQGLDSDYDSRARNRDDIGDGTGRDDYFVSVLGGPDLNDYYSQCL
ncbi:Uu.00g125100.m01.CDS01 [Anthostomella pinea]|uniref:Uu.00g125100.m01.CDS01 n=1 Tax=Anthostomella pinea TaxID=933095 RepID=A0AAI8YHP0_9PEZI|nr:Uu.00g125100.m01.CDS01 [Anthostomella pinea]